MRPLADLDDLQGPPPRQGLGMRSVLLIMSEPEMTKITTSGCSCHGPSVQTPPQRLSSTRPRQAASARTPVRTTLVGIGVPSKYFTLSPPSERLSAVTLKRARRLTPQHTK